jgi:hypothetical protein
VLKVNILSLKLIDQIKSQEQINILEQIKPITPITPITPIKPITPITPITPENQKEQIIKLNINNKENINLSKIEIKDNKDNNSIKISEEMRKNHIKRQPKKIIKSKTPIIPITSNPPLITQNKNKLIETINIDLSPNLYKLLINNDIKIIKYVYISAALNRFKSKICMEYGLTDVADLKTKKNVYLKSEKIIIFGLIIV